MKKNAFSRVLALVLALIMVVGNAAMLVVAEEAHDHDANTVTTHPAEGDHTLVNCPNAVKIGDTVAPTCTKWGYTKYQCPDCECFFLEDFVKPLGDGNHDWKVTKAATCEKDGEKKCSICGTTETIPAGHTWDKETAEDCTVGKICTVCGKVVSGPHTWSETPTEILSKPTKLTDGEAEYTCTVCGATKIVPIVWGTHFPGDHDWKPVDEVPAGCTTTGTKAHQYCEGCDRYEIWVDDVKDKDGNVTVKAHWEECDKEDLVIPALGHDFTPVYDDNGNITNMIGDRIVDVKNHTCKADLECTRGNCDAHQVVDVPHVNVKKIDESAKPTCEEFGYDSLTVCKHCGFITMVNAVPPLGHITYEEALKAGKVTVGIDPTCNEDGLATWTCGRDGCQHECQKVLPKLGAKHVTVTVPATCAEYAYTYTYCANGKYCDCSYKNGDKTVLYTFEYKFTVKDLDNKDYSIIFADENNEDSWVKLISYSVDFKGGYDPDNHVKGENYWATKGNPATCERPGDRTWYCESCNKTASEVIPQLHHTTFEEAVAHDAEKKLKPGDKDAWVIVDSCDERKWYCPNCSHQIDEDGNEIIVYVGGTPKGHTFVSKPENVVAPTCVSEGYTYYVCSVCGESDVDKAGNKVKHDIVPKVEYVYGSYYENLEAAQKVHKGLAEKYETYKKGDCETIGLYEYKCADCGMVITVREDNTGNGHYWDGKSEYTEAKKATCTENAWTAGFTCACGEVVEAEEIKGTALGHTNTACGTACERCGKNELVHNYTCSTTDAHHIFNSFGRDFTITFGGIHAICGNCGDEVVYNYDDPANHEIKEAYVAPTCGTEGSVKYSCSKCGEDCDDWSRFDAVIPATGIHHNKAGEVIEDSCLSTVTDRECVECKGKIGQSHNNVVTKKFNATCLSPEYILTTCLDCGKETVEGLGTELGDHDYQQVGNDNATYHEAASQTYKCTVCGKTEVKKQDILKGIGYFVTVDNADIKGAVITDRSLVAVTVSLDANNVDLWSIKFDLNYDNTVLTFEKAEFVCDELNTVAGASDNGTFVTVAAQTHNAEDGSLRNTTINEMTAVVVIYFRVNYAGNTETDLTIGNIDTVVVTEKGSEDVEPLTPYNNSFDIERFLDINKDGDFNIHDMYIIYTIITGESSIEYTALADLDRDGEITMADYLAIFDYYIGSVTYDKLVGRPVLDAE